MAGDLSIINATPFPWHKAFQHAHQMVQWEFPDLIEAGKIVTVASEWDLRGDRSDDTGEAGYTFTAPSGDEVGFQFRAHYDEGPQLSVLLDNVSTSGNPEGSSIHLGVTDSGISSFIFSGSQEQSFASTNPPIDWMHQNLGSIGCLPLKRVCMPASHNSGMSVLHGKKGLVVPENTLAHYTDIAGQLKAGFRFFDIRPVIADGMLMTGHYDEAVGDFDLFNTWQGGNGQSITKIMEQINTFLHTHDELVIINLSHTLDTDKGFEPFSQKQQNRLFEKLLQLKHRYVAPKGVKDLSTLALDDLIKDGPAVLIILDNKQANEHMTASSDFKRQGFYTNAQLPVFNSYSDTDGVREMSQDQISKMHKQRTGMKSRMFLLSWTLTTVLDIREAAGAAQRRLWGDLWGAVRRESYPNFVMVDGIGAGDSPVQGRSLAALCVGIMQRFNDDCEG